jgi:hypothetical protein
MIIVPILEALGLIGPEVAAVVSAVAVALTVIKTWHMLRSVFGGK